MYIIIEILLFFTNLSTILKIILLLYIEERKILRTIRYLFREYIILHNV